MTNASVTVSQLQWEYGDVLLGVDVRRPRFSWQVSTDQEGWRQAAYQIQVATSLATLESMDPDVWDSGKVTSSQMQWIEYGGPPLVSRQRYYWRVKVWGADGSDSAFSAPAWWEMGLLDPRDWAPAAWIGWTPPGPVRWPSLDQAAWIGPANGPQAGRYFLRRQITVDEVEAVEHAWMVMTGDELYTVYLNGIEVARGHFVAVPQWLDLAPYLQSGPNVIGVAVSPRPTRTGVIAQLVIHTPNGVTVTPTDGAWEVAPAPSRQWSDCPPDGWEPVRVLGPYGMAPWGKYHVDVPPAPCVYLRRTFRLKAEPVRARLYATALGIYQARINGQPVSERELAPGWTDYTQRVRYQTYDVTPMLHAGDNAWGTVLADGWYAGYLAWSGRLHFGDYPLAFLGRLVVQYADGSEEVVTTDSQWTAATGPLRSADLLMGTVYDARRDMPGWDQPDFAADGWQPVEVLVDRRVSLIADWSPAIRVTQTLAPVRVTKEAIGRFLVDFGQNFSGRVRLTLPAGSHERVIIRYGEVLQPDGSLYTANLRTARATDVYWPAQTGVQVIEPIHTVHGFRYVEVQGVETLTAESVEGLVVHSDAVKAGRFQSDNALVNQLVSNIDWGLRSNIVGVPTDCPQRDERLGWTGDIQVFAPTALWFRQMGGFLTSWLEELAAAQFPDGAYPDVAPRVRGIQGGVAAWGDAGVLVPWALYQYYGDVRILAQHYPAMQRWVAYLTEHSRNGLRAAEGYGDWLFVEAETPKDVVATAYYAHVVQIVAKVARVLGYWRDAARYQQQFGQIADAFCRAFVAPDGRIQGDTQTGYVLALAFGLAPSPIAGAFLQRLVGLIHARQDHIDTGFLGVGHILHVLSARGYHQLACRLVTQEDYPSWGYMIRQGATTIWERWNGMLPDGSGFANVRMNSFNHYALGAVGDWLYRYVAGIRPQQPGFAAVEIEPGLDLDAFRAVQAAYPSPFGEVTVRWTHTPQGLSGEVTVPAGVVATVRWPAQAPGALDARDSLGNPLFPTAWRNDRAEYQVGSGRYAFAARMVPGE